MRVWRKQPWLPAALEWCLKAQALAWFCCLFLPSLPACSAFVFLSACAFPSLLALPSLLTPGQLPSPRELPSSLHAIAPGCWHNTASAVHR